MKKESTNFKSKLNDPGFLAAKGKFRGQSEDERDKIIYDRDYLLKHGKPGDHPDVVDLTRQINELDLIVDSERRRLKKYHIKQLTSAILLSLNENRYAVVRSIGEAATYNAVRSILNVFQACEENNIKLSLTPKTDLGNLGHLRDQQHVDSVNAISFEVKVND